MSQTASVLSHVSTVARPCSQSSTCSLYQRLSSLPLECHALENQLSLSCFLCLLTTYFSYPLHSHITSRCLGHPWGNTTSWYILSSLREHNIQVYTVILEGTVTSWYILSSLKEHNIQVYTVSFEGTEHQSIYREFRSDDGKACVCGVCICVCVCMTVCVCVHVRDIESCQIIIDIW